MRYAPESRAAAIAAAKWLWAECCARSDPLRHAEYFKLLRATDDAGAPLLTFADKLAVYQATPPSSCKRYEQLLERRAALHGLIFRSLTRAELVNNFDAICAALDRSVLDNWELAEAAPKDAEATPVDSDGDSDDEEARLVVQSENPLGEPEAHPPPPDFADMPCRGKRGCVDAVRCCPRLFLGPAPAEWPPADRRCAIGPQLAEFEERAARAHDPAAEHDWNVFHFWDDGKITSQKADNLLWERSLFQTVPAIEPETPLCRLPFEPFWKPRRTFISLGDMRAALALRAELLAATGRTDTPANAKMVAFEERIWDIADKIGKDERA